MININEKLSITGIATLTFEDKKGNKEVYKIKNLVVDQGIQSIWDALNNFSHIALGDDATAVAGSQTSLFNEYARRPIQSQNTVINKKYLSTFFGFLEGNGTINEIGVFTDGTATLNSGNLFSRISTENSGIPKVKTNARSLTID
jgi:hypothetical protein